MPLDIGGKFVRAVRCVAAAAFLMGATACGSNSDGSGSNSGTGSGSSTHSGSASHTGGSSGSSDAASGSSTTGGGTQAPPVGPDSGNASGSGLGGSGSTSGSIASGGAKSGAGSGSLSSDAGATSMQPEGGAADDGGGASESGTMPPPHQDLGKGDGTDVVMLGDSWMSNTLQIEGTGGGIVPALQQVAMQPYPNYAVQGTMMLMDDSFGPAIPSQWPEAKAANPNIKTVVMTGGGNDIIQNATLQADCQSGGDMCKMTLLQISSALNTLWTQMSTDGVQDIVYIAYSDNVGTVAPSLRGTAGTPTPSICTSGKIRCWRYDTTPDVAAADLASDGIHPLAEANQRIATNVYALMTMEGMRR